MFCSGHNEGELTQEDVAKFSDPYPNDASIRQKTVAALSESDALARMITLRGTPAVIIMPANHANHANRQNSAVFPGACRHVISPVGLASGLNINMA